MEQLWLTSSFGPSNGESRSSTDHGSNKTALIGAAASTTDLQPNQAPSPISGFPVTSGDRLPPDPKMTNKQLLMSIQRYHRGSPKCHNRFIWKRDGRRHHAFPPQVVPYPIAVDREASNLDVIDNLFFDGFCGTASLFHSGMLPIPRRVLDIGCGNGSWIKMAASEWPECRFIGLDCVPLFPDLSRINSGLAKRVQYVNGNFLEQPLPFPSEFFDYVHVKHIAKGVPEDKWDLIFEEISRVLVPGGAVEVTEEDILFPRARLPASKKRPIMQRQHRSPSLPPPAQTNNPAPPYDIRQRTISSPLAPPTSDQFSYLYQNSSPISAHSELTIERAQPKWSNSREQSPSSPHTYSPLFSGDEYVPESVDPTFSPITQYSSSPPKQPTTFQLRPRPSLPSFYSSPQSPPTILPIVLADDELLERLYLSVYDRRRINLRPTSFIGNLLPIHFKKTSASPHICQYMSSTRSTKRNAGAVTNVPKTNMKGAGRYKPPGSKLEGLQQRPHTSTIIEEGSIDDAWDDIMRKVGMILRQEETMVLQIHRTISDIVACKEAMWEELMIMNGWSDFDFDSPGKARLIRQERSKFDEIVEKYRINLQSRYPFKHVVETKLHWKAPKEEPKTNQKSRTAFSDSEIDDEHEESDFTEDEGPQEDGNNDVEHGILLRRMRIFCAFKADLE